MANEKYLDYNGLSHYDEKIKEEIVKSAIPASTASDSGKFLRVGANGKPEWESIDEWAGDIVPENS